MNVVRYQFLFFLTITIKIIVAQAPFLEFIPYATPEFEQYSIKHHTDHNYPTQTPNGVNARFDGNIFYNNITAFNCPPRIS